MLQVCGAPPDTRAATARSTLAHTTSTCTHTRTHTCAGADAHPHVARDERAHVLLRAEQPRLRLELPHAPPHVVLAEPRARQVRPRRVEPHARVAQRLQRDAEELARVVRERDAPSERWLQQVGPRGDWAALVARAQDQVPLVRQQHAAPPGRGGRWRCMLRFMARCVARAAEGGATHTQLQAWVRAHAELQPHMHTAARAPVGAAPHWPQVRQQPSSSVAPHQLLPAARQPPPPPVVWRHAHCGWKQCRWLTAARHRHTHTPAHLVARTRARAHTHTHTHHTCRSLQTALAG
jgi:hypothetical protein